MANMPVLPYKVYEAILGCSKGRYQEDLLNGSEHWSGRGCRHMGWQHKYYWSRVHLLQRIRKAIEPFGWKADVKGYSFCTGPYQVDLILSKTKRGHEVEVAFSHCAVTTPKTVYKAVAETSNGTLVSVFDGTTRYTIGEKTSNRLKEDHGGGIYCYATEKEAFSAVFPRSSSAKHLPTKVLKCKSHGRKCLVYGHRKLAVYGVTPLEVVA